MAKLNPSLNPEKTAMLAGGRPWPPPLPEPGSPLSYGQRSLWLLHRLAPESRAYHISAAARVLPPLDLGGLRRALSALADRHLVLRATFHFADGEPHQRIGAGLAPELREADASGWSESELEEHMLQEAGGSFDLETGPLMRVTLWRRAPTEDRLQLTIHHIVSDFWTLSLLTRELSAFYAAESTGTRVDLPPPSLSYAEHVRQEQERLAGPDGDRLWGYWRDRLGRQLSILELPTDRPRPPVQSYAGACVSLRLGAELSRHAARLARAGGTTLSSTLLAAFLALIHRYTGQEEVVVGTPTAGRRRSELGATAGYFVNPVVLRTDLSGRPDFTGLLERVRRTTVDAYDHQDYPFALLAEKLQPERDPSRSPLFQVMFQLLKARRPEERALVALALREEGATMSFGGHFLESIAWPEQTSQLDLALRIGEVGESLVASLQYNSDLFDAGTPRRLLGHLQILLAAAMTDPSRPIAELPLLTTGESDQILLAWSGALGERPAATCCLHELFEVSAARAPEAPALIDGERCWTYAELSRRSNQLAHHLRRLGVCPEQRVGVLMDRSGEMVAALLSILKAGGAYVPLDPAYPDGWLASAVEDAQISLLLTEPRFFGKLAGRREVNATGEAVSHEPDTPPEPLAGAGNLAYILYTSGSTGRPKGVAIEHRAPVARMHWVRAAFPSEALSGVLASTSICFDLSVFEIFAPLSWGGTVILAENVLALPALPGAQRVTLVNTVPSAMAELVSARLPPALRTVCLAGEALPPPLAERIYRHEGVEEVLNLYGPTEDATYSTCARIARRASRVSIGRPLPGTRAYVLNGHLDPVPAGVPGELFLAGAGGARGYFGRPDLTADRFIPSPLGTDPGERLYRTGDLARWLPNGELDHLGRLDQQVKVRGFRIELEEIEGALREHPQVREAAVVLRECPAGARSLTAYVAPAEASGAALRRALQDRLPAYMVPATCVLLPALPRTPSGKVDRRSLPADTGEQEASFAAPRTATEELVAEVWADVLAVPRVGVGDSFFGLGGHSLLAARAATHLQSLFGVPVSLQQILQSPTVAELAAQIDARRRASRDPALPPLQRTPRQPPPLLSYAQERLWFLAQLEPASPAYHMAAALELRGVLRVDLLAAALAELVRRHETLRTSFSRQEQVIAPFTGQPLPVVDLEPLPPAARAAELRRVALEEARRPFDLRQSPLLRVFLLRAAAREHVLALTLHHIISDGWSLGVLAREVTAAYTALAQGGRPELPELPVQYADFAMWQRSWLEGGEMERQLGYWRRELAGAPAALELATDRPRPPVQTFRGAQRSLRLAPAASAALAGLGRREGATLFMTLAALSAVLLARWARQPDIVLGTPIANRSRAEIEGLIGLFANTLALRIQIARESGFRSLLHAVRQTALDAYAHQDLPFEKLVDEMQIARLPGRPPLFQVLMGLWNAPLGELALPGVSASRMDLDLAASKLDLILRFASGEDGIAIQAEFATDLFDAVTIERLLSQLQVLLAGAVAAPERCLVDLPLLGPGELHQLVYEWNDTEHGGEPACIHDLFEIQARRSPEALAVEDGGERLTWRQLSGRSSRLARSLRHLGVGVESCVGVFLPRSVDQIVAIFGVLKAGAAYVPLDPASPPERLRMILEEAAIAVVVTLASLREALPAGCTAVLPPQDESAEPSHLPDLSPQRSAGPETLAYILYTSGSTGRPKGVMVEHRSVVNLLAALRETVYCRAGAPLRVAVNAPLVFDASVKQWIQLLDGHSLYVVPEDVRPHAERMLQLLREREVQVLDCTPAQLSYLLAAGLLRQPGSLERVLAGGEELPRADWSLLAASERTAFYNVYGPTECTVDATSARVRSDRPVLGRPLANVRIHLLDTALHPVPPGIPGEICIGGAGVARGYVCHPAQTAERFVPDPWGTAPGARMYRTGDLGLRSADGTLEFLGRLDHQVKVHGIRIELEEIEAVLSEHPGVLTAAVLAPTDELGQTRLVAYVACPGAPSPSAGELRAHGRRKLPDYMIPSRFYVLADLPRTRSGKIDRAALLALDHPAEEHHGGEEPDTPLEKVLAGMMAEVLGLERIGLHDNFFELGGHSMRAAELAAAVRETFGIDLPLFHVFDAPTVAGLAAVLLDSPEWHQIVDELAPALLQLTELPAGPGGLAQDGEP